MLVRCLPNSVSRGIVWLMFDQGSLAKARAWKVAWLGTSWIYVLDGGLMTNQCENWGIVPGFDLIEMSSVFLVQKQTVSTWFNSQLSASKFELLNVWILRKYMGISWNPKIKNWNFPLRFGVLDLAGTPRNLAHPMPPRPTPSLDATSTAPFHPLLLAIEWTRCPCEWSRASGLRNQRNKGHIEAWKVLLWFSGEWRIGSLCCCVCKRLQPTLTIYISTFACGRSFLKGLFFIKLLNHDMHEGRPFSCQCHFPTSHSTGLFTRRTD